MSWQTLAACRDANPELFFPAGEDYTAPTAATSLSTARAVCSSCPVARECLTWAVESGEEFGIWSGTTPAERRVIRRDRLTGAPDPLVDVDPMCGACSLLFVIPAVDGHLCAACQERGRW